jgi:hypothetical protein
LEPWRSRGICRLRSLIKNKIAAWNAASEIVAVFHTNAGHVTLHDTAYNADRNIATGNSYKDLISDLQKRGAARKSGYVLCADSMVRAARR